jgi:hypothetical protein
MQYVVAMRSHPEIHVRTVNIDFLRLNLRLENTHPFSAVIDMVPSYHAIFMRAFDEVIEAVTNTGRQEDH